MYDETEELISAMSSKDAETAEHENYYDPEMRSLENEAAHNRRDVISR